MSPQSACFVAWFALSVLFHVLNTGTSFRMLIDPSHVSWWYLALGVCGIALLLMPVRAGRGSTALTLVLALLIIVTVWLEAPILGNHWLVSGLVALGGVLAAIHVTVSARSRSLSRVDDLVVPLARGVFFVFYSFSALAKLNRAFLDPSVSCANFFAEETVRSLGWGSASLAGSGFSRQLLPWAVVGIEFAVVALLVARRTRIWGVLLAVLFHGVIALDGKHPFADFTALVYAFVALFLPDHFFVWIRGLCKERLGIVVGTLRIVVATAMAALLVVQGLLLNPSWWEISEDLKYGVWRFIGAAAAALMIAYAVHHGRRRVAVSSGFASDVGSARVVPSVRWLLVVPALAALNGITPYVGVKTGNSWNMYSNLVTADGYENHLVVPTWWRWTDRQDDLVRIIGSSDPLLDAYARSGFLVPMINLRDHLSRSGPVSLQFVRLGAVPGDSGADTVVRVDDTRAEPELSRPLSSWERRLFAYRLIDSQRPARCQDSYSPLR